MGELFDVVTTFLQADGWPLQRIGQETAYSMTAEGEHGRWTCIAQVVEEEALVLFYSACPFTVPVDRRVAVGELLHRVNFSLLIGNFELDWEEGHIRYRTSVDLRGQRPGALLISQLVYRNVLTMDKYLPAIQAVIQGKLSPVQALAQIKG